MSQTRHFHKEDIALMFWSYEPSWRGIRASHSQSARNQLAFRAHGLRVSQTEPTCLLVSTNTLGASRYVMCESCVGLLVGMYRSTYFLWFLEMLTLLKMLVLLEMLCLLEMLDFNT